MNFPFQLGWTVNELSHMMFFFYLLSLFLKLIGHAYYGTNMLHYDMPIIDEFQYDNFLMCSRLRLLCLYNLCSAPITCATLVVLVRKN